MIYSLSNLYNPEANFMKCGKKIYGERKCYVDKMFLFNIKYSQ